MLCWWKASLAPQTVVTGDSLEWVQPQDSEMQKVETQEIHKTVKRNLTITTDDEHSLSETAMNHGEGDRPAHLIDDAADPSFIMAGDHFNAAPPPLYADGNAVEEPALQEYARVSWEEAQAFIDSYQIPKDIWPQMVGASNQWDSQDLLWQMRQSEYESILKALPKERRQAFQQAFRTAFFQQYAQAMAEDNRY